MGDELKGMKLHIEIPIPEGLGPEPYGKVTVDTELFDEVAVYKVKVTHRDFQPSDFHSLMTFDLEVVSSGLKSKMVCEHDKWLDGVCGRCEGC